MSQFFDADESSCRFSIPQFDFVCFLSVGILVLVALSIPIVLDWYIDQGRCKNSLSDSAQIRICSLESACEIYRNQVGEYPTALVDLCRRPAGLNASQWSGPYVMTEAKYDPWGNAYLYFANEEFPSVSICSAGPDGKYGTDDDILN